MLDAGDRACVMAVSSHALGLHRADAFHFTAALLTNPTWTPGLPPTTEEYFDAKRRLFVGEEPPGVSVINIGDPGGARIADELEKPRSPSPLAPPRATPPHIETPGVPVF
jgi:UDP-N-acetylmuramoyl-L-alanyl-D-glutamate--2,6-diaminopimelate ligase